MREMELRHKVEVQDAVETSALALKQSELQTRQLKSELDNLRDEVQCPHISYIVIQCPQRCVIIICGKICLCCLCLRISKICLAMLILPRLTY